jgi:dinuclear metal center YbgI/SA1388 family protein
MVKVVDIITRLDELLQPGDFPDLGPNGLQVPGVAEVNHVVTGVSATKTLIERAIDLDAGLILVHHGLFWDFHPTGLSPVLAERLRPLFKHDVNLAAYHLPLDAHPEHGNNALLAEALGCASHEPFGDYRGRAIGRAGAFAGDGVPIADLLARVEETTGRAPLLQGAGPDRVRTIGIVSGSGSDALPEAVEKGLDALLTGEPREHVMGDAEESGIHFIAAGHYGTETLGIRRLGELLEREFEIHHTFVDLPNPV